MAEDLAARTVLLAAMVAPAAVEACIPATVVWQRVVRATTAETVPDRAGTQLAVVADLHHLVGQVLVRTEMPLEVRRAVAPPMTSVVCRSLMRQAEQVLAVARMGAQTLRA